MDIFRSIYLFHLSFLSNLPFPPFFLFYNFTSKKLGERDAIEPSVRRKSCRGQLDTDGRNLRRGRGEGKNNERAVRPHVSHLETRTRWNHSWAEIRSVARTARFKFDTSMPKIQRRYLLLFPQSPRILIFRREAATMHPFFYITRSIAHLSSRVSSFANFYSSCWEKIIIRNDSIR